MTLTEEDFEAWRANAVTEWVMRALTAEADAAEEAFKASAWNSGLMDPVRHANVAAQARAYRDFSTYEFGDFADMLGDSD